MQTSNNIVKHNLIDNFNNLFKGVVDEKQEQSNGFSLKANQSVIIKYCAELSKLTDKDIPVRGTILYHGLGTGKTITALKCAVALTSNTRKIMYFLIPASLSFNPWLSSMTHGLGRIPKLNGASVDDLKNEAIAAKLGSDLNAIKKVLATRYDIHIIHHNANNMLNVVNEAINQYTTTTSKYKNIEIINPFDNSVVVIDEIHDFINTLVNTKKEDNQKMIVYNLLMRAKNMRIISATGTPFVNTPFEMAFLINLHRGWEIFDVKSDDSRISFLETYFYAGEMSTTKVHLMSSLYGIVSYYKTNEADMPQKNYMPIKFIEMNETQDRLFQYFERKRIEKVGDSADPDEISMATLQARSSRISALNAKGGLLAALSAGRLKMTDQDGSENFDDNDYRVGQRMNSNWCIPFHLAEKLGIKEPYTISAAAPSDNPGQITDMRIALNTLVSKFNIDLIGNLHHFSPKIHQLFKIIKGHMNGGKGGPFMIYSNFKNYGIYPISVLLEKMGYGEYTVADGDNLKPANRFVMFTGDQDSKSKNILNSVFNNVNNKNGDYIRFILITGAGKQGISLSCIRACFILEPYWTTQLTEQVEGRAVRIGSHKTLPADQQHVDIYKFISVAPKSYDSIDLLIANIAQRKSIQIEQMKRLLMKSAIDCVVHINTNFPNNKPDEVCIKFDKNQAVPYPVYGNKIIYYRNAKTTQLRRIEHDEKIYIVQYDDTIKYQDIPEKALEDILESELVMVGLDIAKPEPPAPVAAKLKPKLDVIEPPAAPAAAKPKPPSKNSIARRISTIDEKISNLENRINELPPNGKLISNARNKLDELNSEREQLYKLLAN